MASPTFTQVTFRGRDDDGSETGATWKDVQGADWQQDTELNFRVRFLIDETNNRAWNNYTWDLYYSINSSGYSQVTDTTPVQVSPSSNFTDGDDCTSQLTGGSGAFDTDNNGMKEATGSIVNTGAADNYFEVEYCLILDSQQLSQDDVINLRIYEAGSTIAVYSDTPAITVNIAAQNINETAQTDKIITIAGASQVNVQDIGDLDKFKDISVDAFGTFEETLYDS